MVMFLFIIMSVPRAAQYGIMDLSGNISNVINSGLFEVNTTFSKSNFCISLVPES